MPHCGANPLAESDALSPFSGNFGIPIPMLGTGIATFGFCAQPTHFTVTVVVADAAAPRLSITVNTNGYWPATA
jgi:hypothetical protein